MVLAALKLGYRHLDTAYGYGNEEAVGRAIRDSGVPREEIFLTTKLTGKHHGTVKEGFEISMKALNAEYIDLYLMHWPQASHPDTGKSIPYGESPTFVETWKSMEKLLSDKRCRAIGVSNFSVKLLTELAAECSTIPAANQVESHPYLPQTSLHEYCKEKGIVLTAYSPLGQPKPSNPSPVLAEPVAKQLAEKYKTPVGTILLSWLIQRGWTTVPKSANPERLKQNMDLVKLSSDDFNTLSEVHKQRGKLMHLCIGQEDIMEKGVISGWSLEDMGWEKMD